MQETSEVFNRLLNENHYVETNVTIGSGGGLLIDQDGYGIVFGSDRINVDPGTGGSGYSENMLISVQTNISEFSGGYPSVGNAIAGEISLSMHKPIGVIERMAKVSPWIRLVGEEEASEWIQKGTFYIDTREYEEDAQGRVVMTIHGYDAMLKTEVDFPFNAPIFDEAGFATDIEVVTFIANQIGIAVDPRTVELMDKGYTIPRPLGYTMREVLRFIAGMYAGNFIIADAAQQSAETGLYTEMLRLLPLRSYENPTQFLVDNSDGSIITFGRFTADEPGEVRILV